MRVLVHRLQKKFRELLEAEVSKTVVTEENIAEELNPSPPPKTE